MCICLDTSRRGRSQTTGRVYASARGGGRHLACASPSPLRRHLCLSRSTVLRHLLLPISSLSHLCGSNTPRPPRVSDAALDTCLCVFAVLAQCKELQAKLAALLPAKAAEFGDPVWVVSPLTRTIQTFLLSCPYPERLAAAASLAAAAAAAAGERPIGLTECTECKQRWRV